jgi:DnaK suppressor protein
VEDLRTELDAIIQSTTEVPDDEHDAEGATIGYERARVAALLAKAQKDLADCETALLRVKLGSYGACVGCGAEIPAERLAALPSTSVCEGCANGYLTLRRDPTHRR